MTGRDPGKRGNRDDVMVPHNVYRCAGNDQWAAIAVNTEMEWQALCTTLGHEEWLTILVSRINQAEKPMRPPLMH